MKPASDYLKTLPIGTLTVDRTGKVVVSTLPLSFPKEITQLITQTVIGTFQNARKARLDLSEIQVRFASFKLIARELKGGALIYLVPGEINTPV